MGGTTNLKNHFFIWHRPEYKLHIQTELKTQPLLTDLMRTFKAIHTEKIAATSEHASVLQQIPPEPKHSQTMHTITDVETHIKMLGIEWNTNLDHF